jgi:hypothetical protein
MQSDSIRSSARFPFPARAILLGCALILAFGSARAQTRKQGGARAETSASPAAPDALPANWNDAVELLADKIVAVSDKSKPATLEVNNISSLTAAEAAEVDAALGADLSQRLHIGSEPGSQTPIVVTLSESEAAYVWVAQVSNAGAQKVAMVSIPREGHSAVRGERPAMSLQRKIVWSQREPFLDFAVSQGGADGVPQVVILETGQIASYEERNGTWTASATIALHPTASLPRDARGMIWQGPGELEVLLPGEACSGPAGNVLSLSCAPYPSTNPEMRWPMVTAGPGRVNATFQANRNFFIGTGMAGQQTGADPPTFYTAADIGGQEVPAWLLAGLDGKTRLLEGDAKAQVVFSGWGDDIAAIQSGCSVGPEVLVTGTGDWTQPDHIQMYEVRDRQALAAGQPLDFPGPIFALWPSMDLKSARVVSENLQTGMYEASIVSVSCGD